MAVQIIPTPSHGGKSAKLNAVLELGLNGKLQTGHLVRMKNKRGISQHFSSTHRSKMTNRSKIEVMDCLQYVAGGEELLVDNSFHFYIMIETFLCNVQVIQVIASYLSTILVLVIASYLSTILVPPLQTCSHLDLTQQGNLYTDMDRTKKGNIMDLWIVEDLTIFLYQ